jgi:hypothetical protein
MYIPNFANKIFCKDTKIISKYKIILLEIRTNYL